MSIYIYTNKENGLEQYTFEENAKGFDPKKYDCKKYATLSDAIRDSYVWQNGHYSDGECLDYIMRAIEQLEGVSK